MILYVFLDCWDHDRKIKLYDRMIELIDRLIIYMKAMIFPLIFSKLCDETTSYF